METGTYDVTPYVNRENAELDLQIDYYIPGYSDPEDGEYFGDTSYYSSYTLQDGTNAAGDGGYSGESGSSYTYLGLNTANSVSHNVFQFNAYNTFSGDSVFFQLDVFDGALATSDQTVTGTAGADIALTGSGDDFVRTLDGDDLIDLGDGDDIADGGDGADRLDGGAGNDTLIGGAGNDLYYVDSTGDVVVERAGGGYDTVIATTSVTLDANVEQLQLLADGAIDGTGNAGANRIDGYSGANVLTGLGGDDQLYGYDANDTLDGGDGDDVLDGGSGADRMIGGAGDDSYVVDTPNDQVIEAAGGGTDVVRIRTLASYTLGANVENLYVERSAGASGTGNELANYLLGFTGNDRLDGAAGDDTIDGGAGNDTLTGGAGADHLTGGAGTDTASYAATSAKLRIDLAAGIGSHADAQGDTYDGIENVLGGSGDDVIVGDALANTLDGNGGNDRVVGGAGDDTLIGGAGADNLNGGAGSDTVSYAGSVAAVTVDLAAMTASGGDAAGDTLTGFENAAGGLGNDALFGNALANALFGDAGVDTIDGGGGNDLIEGGAGADVLIGGAGLDRLNYHHSSAAVTVNLLTGVASGGDAQGDSFSGFERISGSAFGDVLTGDGGANTLFGGAGDDTLMGGDGNDTIAGGTGADTMDGGAGIDTLSYANAARYVSVSLTDTSAGYYAGDAAYDQYTGFENLTGSNFADALYGNSGANVINGGAGGDYIYGGGGNDVLIGGAGDDVFLVTYGSGAETIRDFHAGDGSEDEIYISLSTDYDTFGEVMSAARTVNGNTVFDFGGGNRLTLTGVTASSLTASDFYFDS